MTNVIYLASKEIPMAEPKSTVRVHSFIITPTIIVRKYMNVIGTTPIGVLLALASFANNDSHDCWPSHATLAKIVGCHPNTIRRSLEILENAGLLRIEQRYDDDGGQTSNIYTLLIPDDNNDIVKIDNCCAETHKNVCADDEKCTDTDKAYSSTLIPLPTNEHPPLPTGDDPPCPQMGTKLDSSELNSSELDIVDSVESTPSAGLSVPTSFQAWLDLIQESANRIAVLRHMYETLYPKHDPPDYGKIGRAAKVLGGASRLAAALWETATRPPTGCVLEYVIAAENNRRDRAKHDARGAPRYGKDKPAYLKHEFTPEQLAKMACGETVI